MMEWYQMLRMEMGSGSILGYFLQALPAALLAGLVYAVSRVLWLRKLGRRRESWPKELTRFLFVCYLTGLSCLVILPANYPLSLYDALVLGWWDQVPPLFRPGVVHLIPTIVEYLSGSLTLGSWVRQMLVLNIAMLIPLGFFLPVLSANVRGKFALLLAVLIPLAMELLQLAFGRSFDLDDILCNFAGIVMGYLLARAVQKLDRKGRPA